ncbi:leucine-rich repeat domain-containing protein [Leyella stercorea]|uniref:leucine-rich repeat domain-containing protein n=1 Tax=Leyella stercorea TaxID=363265 RepID=UPI003A952B04
MKRVYFTLALMSLFGGLNAFAQTYKTIGGVKYGLMNDNKTCIVIGDAGATGDITFLKEVEFDDGMHTVTGVCGSEDYKDVTGQENGFSGNVNITSITFEDGSQITWIGDHAFKNCLNLKTINKVPDVLNEIKPWCFEGTALESVDLSNTNVTIMKDGVFFNNISLTSIKLPNKLENFWDNAFNGCTALNNIVMPSTVVGIYNSVFEGCAALTNVKLNEGCTTLGHHVFKKCPLATVTFPNTLNSIGEYAFEGTTLTTVDLSNTQITSLPKGCFYDCEQLSDVKLPKELTYIGQVAFFKSTIASITFPPTLQKIDSWAFQYSKLANVVIPTNCSSIDQAAFANNDKLTTVVINGTDCYLAYQAFWNCSKLKDVYITSKSEPKAERYGFPFDNNPKVHVMKDYVDVISGLTKGENGNPCNTDHFDSNFSITLGKEWTTFTSAYNLDFSNVEGGLTAYTAKYNKDNDAVALTPVKKVKAHTGLILKGEAGKSYTLPILNSNEDALDAVTDNQLVDCVDALWSTGRDNDYFLSDGKFVKSTNNGWALPGKSYLYINGGRANKSESPLRVYVDNTATAINGITTNPVVKDEAYYNLQGVKVQRPQHGVFIHNGKKVVLK